MITSNQGLASDLFVYLIKGADRTEQEYLLNRVKQLRSFTDDKGTKVWRDFSGKDSKFESGSDFLPL